MAPISQRVLAVLALLAAPLAAGCMPDTPETMLSWNVNDRAPVHRRAAAPASKQARTYVYQDRYYKTPRPTPRPAPNYVTTNVTPYTPTARPAAYSPVPRESAPAGDMRFVWPVNGTVISTFGSGLNGERNDGINIAAPSGTPIHAAASGTVTYAGNELKGYGNLLLIKHADGYVTAYAHADRLLVSRGDFVAKGQVIGYAGTTGDVTSPQLHFEIRNGVTPVNPERYLSARAGA